MEHTEYKKIAKIGENFWWFRALHRNLLNALKVFVSEQPTPLLDIGCGAGGFLRRFCKVHNDSYSVGLELDFSTAAIANERSDSRIVTGSANSLPFHSSIFSICVAADLLYHKSADPEKISSEVFRCLKPGGLFLINEPAYQWLFSTHDRKVFGVRRFTRVSLATILKGAGFNVRYSTHWNTFLFALMVVWRKVARKIFMAKNSNSDLILMPPIVEQIFNAIMVLEGLILYVSMKIGLVFLPFGGSVLIIGERPLNDPEDCKNY